MDDVEKLIPLNQTKERVIFFYKKASAKTSFSVLALATFLFSSAYGSDGQSGDLEDISARQELLAVGPGAIDSDETGTAIIVLGQSITIDFDTVFPHGAIANGAHVAITGTLDSNGAATAKSVVDLGGLYSVGNSPIYVRGRISTIDSDGVAVVGSASVDLSQAYYNASLADLTAGSIVEIVGFEGISTSPAQLVATVASNLTGITGSGVRGIAGSGVRGITRF